MSETKKAERLDKFLSHHGFASRRDIKKFLKYNEVAVNKKRVTVLGFRVFPGVDTVTVNGEEIVQKGFTYFALNKPMGYISTTSDNWGRESVVDLIDTLEKIFPIGRLDKDTRGLILLTNDGELTHKLIHPKYHVDKTYRLTVAESPTDAQLMALRTGVLLRDGITLPANAEIVDTVDGNTIIALVIREGKNRQIRRMCETVGLKLLDLQRISFGPISLGTLEEGAYRELTTEEVAALQKSTVR